MDFVHVDMQGRLVDDPETKTTKDGTVVTKFTVASNRRLNNGEERTSYVPVTTFGNLAVQCSKFLSKGREAHVWGDFETDSYTDRNGIKRKGFGVIANDVRFGRGGTKSEDSDDASPTDFDNLSEEDKARAIRAMRSGRTRG